MWPSSLQVLVLLAVSDAVVAQDPSPEATSSVTRSLGSISFLSDGPHSTSHDQPSILTGTVAPTFTPGGDHSTLTSSTGDNGDSATPTNQATSAPSSDPVGTFLSTSNAPGATSSANPTVGLETIEFVSISTINGAQKKRQVAAVTVPQSSAVCPIPSGPVAGVPCYPCVVGQPVGQQTLFVRTTSVVGAAPDPTPVFFYSFCQGCQGTLVTTPVPGYTAAPDSRNLASCLIVPAAGGAAVTSAPQGLPAPVVGAQGGLTTTAIITATIIYQLEVVTTCTVNGGVTTVYQESTTCSTYSTCVTIPETLCETFVSTQPNGALTTCTTPVDSWTQILTTTPSAPKPGVATAGGVNPVATGPPAGNAPPVQPGAGQAGAVGGAVPPNGGSSPAGIPAQPGSPPTNPPAQPGNPPANTPAAQPGILPANTPAAQPGSPPVQSAGTAASAPSDAPAQSGSAPAGTTSYVASGADRVLASLVTIGIMSMALMLI